MRFRARLNTTRTLERPVQIFCNHLPTARDWAARILSAPAAIEGDTVTIFRLDETPVDTLMRTKRDAESK